MPQPESQRPRAVTLIGRIWLVLAVLSLLRSVGNLIVWTALRPAVPSLVDALNDKDPRTLFLGPIFAHFVSVNVTLAALSLAVGVCAWQLLRLRSWARPAVQVISGLALLYVVCFGLLWTWAWTRVPAESATRAHANRGLLLAAGLALCLIFAAGFAAMIASLQSRRVRQTFFPSAAP
ncbi:MAG TPA: hypothetical protein VJA66_05865 [Thermoanaerobaculia bacterium]